MGRRGIYGALRRLFVRGRSGRRCARGRSASASRRGPPCQASTEAILGPCVEARAAPRRRFQREARHRMAPEDEDEFTENGYYGEGNHVSREQLDHLLKEKFLCLSARKQEEEMRNKKTAKDNILQKSRSGQELLIRADNLIDQDWLGGIDEMPGNIYRIAAFGGIHIFLNAPKRLDALQNIARYFGTFLIVIVQLIAPPALFCTYTIGVGTGKSKQYTWSAWCLLSNDPDCASSLNDWRGEEGWWLPKTAGLVFMCLFSLNGLFVIIDERRAWKQLDCMLKYLDAHTPKFKWSGESMLYLDVFMNCWVVFWCTMDAYLLVGSSRTMKDVLFDSLSLLFLYNLDDVSGDLGFVNADDWDGLRLGWIYDQMVRVNYDPFEPEEIEHTDLESVELEIDALVCIGCYNVTIVFLGIAAFVLPLLAAFTPFGIIAPAD